MSEQENSCIFCKIIKGQIPSTTVYRDEQCMAFMDIAPLSRGHLLIIPLTHTPDLAGLEKATGSHLFQVAMDLNKSIRKSELPCEGLNLLINDGPIAGQEVLHLHLHLIPRVGGDGIGYRFVRKWKPTPQDLVQIAEQIKSKL